MELSLDERSLLNRGLALLEDEIEERLKNYREQFQKSPHDEDLRRVIYNREFELTRLRFLRKGLNQ